MPTVKHREEDPCNTYYRELEYRRSKARAVSTDDAHRRGRAHASAATEPERLSTNYNTSAGRGNDTQYEVLLHRG
jgi:hypothetical protein